MSVLKTLWETVFSNPTGELSAIFIKFEIVICMQTLPVWKSLKLVIWERVKSLVERFIKSLPAVKHSFCVIHPIFRGGYLSRSQPWQELHTALTSGQWGSPKNEFGLFLYSAIILTGNHTAKKTLYLICTNYVDVNIP